MATNCLKALPGVENHRRIVWPTPTGDIWKMGCCCGWETFVNLSAFIAPTVGTVLDFLSARFVEHIPEDQRRRHVKVDARPVDVAVDGETSVTGIAGTWIMPEGVPCRFKSWWVDDDINYVHVFEPVDAILPVSEVLTPDGKVFRIE